MRPHTTSCGSAKQQFFDGILDGEPRRTAVLLADALHDCAGAGDELIARLKRGLASIALDDPSREEIVAVVGYLQHSVGLNKISVHTLDVFAGYSL